MLTSLSGGSQATESQVMNQWSLQRYGTAEGQFAVIHGLFFARSENTFRSICGMLFCAYDVTQRGREDLKCVLRCTRLFIDGTPCSAP